MSKKENKPLIEGNHNIGPFSNCACVNPQKEGFIDAICEVCDKVFKTNENGYICPDCQEKAKNIRQ